MPWAVRDRRRRAMPSVRRRADLVAARGGAGRERPVRAVSPGASRHRPRGRAVKAKGEPVAPEEAFWAVRRCSRPWPVASRSCSSSTISTGPSPRSWTCWSTWPTGCATRRCCSWSWPGQTCSTCGRMGCGPAERSLGPAGAAGRGRAADLLAPSSRARRSSAGAPRRASSRWPTATRCSSRRSSPCSSTTAS